MKTTTIGRTFLHNHPQIEKECSGIMPEDHVIVDKKDWEKIIELLSNTGVGAIAEERQRHITEKGFTAEHDDQHRHGELCKVAAILAVNGTDATVEDIEVSFHNYSTGEDVWGLEDKLSGDENAIHRLKVAGALIAAEIDRIQRSAKKDDGSVL